MLLYVADCAEIAKVTTKTVRQWIARGYFPSTTVYGVYRVRREDFMKFLRNHRRKKYTFREGVTSRPHHLRTKDSQNKGG